MISLKMPDINSILIAGNLTNDPVLRRTGSGTPVANFHIAANRKFKDNAGQWRENVCFVGIVAWYKLAESCCQYLRKGSAVLIEGELQSRMLRNGNGSNNNVVEIKASRIQFLNRQEKTDPSSGLAPEFTETESGENSAATAKREFEEISYDDYYNENGEY